MDATESGMGLLWKDVYKVIKIPQYQYSCFVLDLMKGNNSKAGNNGRDKYKMVVKSKQKTMIDTTPIFEVSYGVDIVNAITSCIPMLPDGSKTWEAADLFTEVASIPVAPI